MPRRKNNVVVGKKKEIISSFGTVPNKEIFSDGKSRIPVLVNTTHERKFRDKFVLSNSFMYSPFPTFRTITRFQDTFDRAMCFPFTKEPQV